VRQVTIPWWTIANGHHDVLYSSARFNGRSVSLELRKVRCNYYSSCFADFVDCASFDAKERPIRIAATRVSLPDDGEILASFQNRSPLEVTNRTQTETIRE